MITFCIVNRYTYYLKHQLRYKLQLDHLLTLHFRVQKLKFHGEDQSILGEGLLRFSSLGIFAYSTFNMVAGGLGVHTDLKNLLVFATGAITIIQVFYNCF